VDIVTETARAYSAFAAGRYSEASDRIKRVLQAAPADPGALTLFGRLSLLFGDAETAHDVFAEVLSRHPGTAALWMDLSLALRDLGRHRQALECARRSVALDATQPGAWIRLGEILLSINERGEASESFKRALAIAPDDVAALCGLARTGDVEAGSAIFERMQALTRSPRRGAKEIAALHYALAQVCRRAGQPEEFIAHLLEANAKQRTLCPDGRAEYAAIFDRLESAFTRENLTRAARAEPREPTPLFVLGMPRSGTTLVEQLLAAHPQVAAGGELDYMRRALRRAMEQETGQPFPQGFETLSAEAMNSLAQAYTRRLRHVSDNARYITDKTPGNFHLLGLLRLLFPRAPIVHVVRDPMDTCFSILQYPFDDRSPHTCDMQLLAYVYTRYRRLMQRWQEVAGDQFITIKYERLVASPAEEARRLYEHCGLEWTDAYLDFHRTANAVRTFSAFQVRQPIYTSSVGAWRPFAEALAPLQQSLAAELGDHTED
jgi:tetratricopeptide (TPR) repeat protein